MQSTGCYSLQGFASKRTGLGVEAGKFSKLGLIWAVRDEDGLLSEFHLTDWGSERILAPPGPISPDLRDAVERYEQGDGTRLASLPLAPADTPFAQRVRDALLAIPWGEVRTYGQIAAAIGKPGATRAVGQVCAKNLLLVVVPCHRVVAASGPGGYRLGLAVKKRLWALEGINVATDGGFG